MMTRRDFLEGSVIAGGLVFAASNSARAQGRARFVDKLTDDAGKYAVAPVRAVPPACAIWDSVWSDVGLIDTPTTNVVTLFAAAACTAAIAAGASESLLSTAFCEQLGSPSVARRT